jgi:hypothetical protein
MPGNIIAKHFQMYSWNPISTNFLCVLLKDMVAHYFSIGYDYFENFTERGVGMNGIKPQLFQ